MRSRAVRRLQDSVRWVPEALQAMICTPWAPHPSHPGRPRLQRPAYEEPLAVETRFLSPAEREDSKQKRQRPSEVNGVLTLAGVYNGREVAAWTEDQQAKHEATLQELRNMDKFGVVEVVDRPQVGQVLWTRCVHKQRLDGTYKVRIVAGGFEQTSQSELFFCWYSQTHHVTDVFSHSLQFMVIRSHSEIVRMLFTSHQCRAILSLVLRGTCT